MTIGTLLNIRQGLLALAECDSPTPLKLTGKERYDIFRALRRAKKATEDYDKAHEGLIKQLGTKKDDGSYAIPPTHPNYLTFLDQETALRDIEVDFTVTSFPLSTLQESPQVSILLIDYLVTHGILTE